MTTTTAETTPKVWAGCLAAYNDGQLHGEWVDCDTDAETIAEAFADMLARSPIPGAEEIYIADREGWAEFTVDEWSTPAELAYWASLLALHGESVALWVAAGYDPDDHEGRYHGLWADVKTYAEELVPWEEIEPHWLRSYVDLDRFARDLEHDLVVIDSRHGGVHIWSA